MIPLFYGFDEQRVRTLCSILCSIYIINDDGLGQVVKPDDKRGTVVGESGLDETVLATPAIAGDALYVRSDKHLWKIASSPSAD